MHPECDAQCSAAQRSCPGREVQGWEAKGVRKASKRKWHLSWHSNDGQGRKGQDLWNYRDVSEIISQWTVISFVCNTGQVPGLEGGEAEWGNGAGHGAHELEPQIPCWGAQIPPYGHWGERQYRFKLLEEEGNNPLVLWAVVRNRRDKGKVRKSGNYYIHPGLR